MMRVADRFKDADKNIQQPRQRVVADRFGLAALDAPEVRRYLNASRVPLSTAALAEPYGWVKGAGKLHDAVLRGAGHMAPRDQPVAALDLLRRWAAGAL